MASPASLPFRVSLVVLSLAACQGGGDNGDVEVDQSPLRPGALDADGDGVPASVDCDDKDPSILGPVEWFSDGDGDGYGAEDANPYLSCTRPTGASSNNLDCDDTLIDTHPGAPEVCGGGDENCNGLVDDEDPGVIGRRSAFADTDFDGYGDENAPVEVCETGAGAETIVGDCDDTRPDVHPDAEEVCRNGIDDNCNGSPDACRWDEVVSIDAVAPTWDSLANDFAGVALGRADDATGDGMPDLLVGIPYSDAHTYNAGAVAVLSGAAAMEGGQLFGDQPSALLLGTDQNGFAGSAVTAADFDGDGFSDVVMGAPDANAQLGAAGRVAIFQGPLSGTLRANAAEASIVGTRTGDRAGRSLHALHDVTGDGTVDLIIGSEASSANSAPVAAWVVSDPMLDVDLSEVPALEIDPLDRSRAHIITVADLNGDGIGDLIIGSPDNGDLDSPEGAVYIHLGPFEGRSHMATSADAMWSGTPGYEAGAAVIADADTNGDGTPDVIVGSPGALGGSGEVAVLEAPLTGGALHTVATRWTGTPSANAGTSLSTLTDDGGQALLLVGGPNADTSALDSGAVWVVPLAAVGSSGIDAISIARFDGSRLGIAGEGAGSSVVGLGDMDGDTYDDFAVGAPNNSNGGVAAGAVYMVRGQGI